MMNEDRHPLNMHLSDEELLLASDGELTPRRATELRAHLAACWNCRARMVEVEETITGFIRAQRHALDPQLPPGAGPRALLRAQLAELRAEPEAAAWQQFFRFSLATRRAAFACAVLLVIAAGAKLMVERFTLSAGNFASAALERSEIPDHSLTPGVTRPVSIRDVCAMSHEQVIREVPASVRQEVFKEYGIANAHTADYEIDYLITPGLGGAEDLHNLWPESYTSQTWNARTKDALEEHLHQMVCAGQLDLSTAQHAIATDWVAAYKKYFHTDKPSFPSPLAVPRADDSPWHFWQSNPQAEWAGKPRHRSRFARS